MADSNTEWIKPGARVNVREKGLHGTVKFFGNTDFAPGKWVGVELDDALGKNNGVVKGKQYFESQDQHGLFVRILQIEPLQQHTPPSLQKSGLRKPMTGRKGISSPAQKRSFLPKPSTGPTPKNTTDGTSQDTPTDTMVTGEVVKPTSFAPPVSATPTSSSSAFSQEINDLQQRVSILQHKRAEDKNKIKELEKFRLQFQQMVEYKNKWAESQSDLQQQLKAAKKEAREAVLTKEQFEEEMRELSDTVEIATLDKEMAEEKSETLQAENEALKERIEELTMDLEILQNEISESGYEGAAASGQVKQLDNQNTRLKEALVKLRDVSNQEKLEHQRALKDLEKQTTTLTSLKEEKDRIEEELKAADDLLATLKEQVDVAMGAEEMVEKLTDTNLQLEEDIDTLKETVADLEAIRDLSEEQEELRVQEEHELREDLDMNMNTVRQMERRLDASQETIVDQLQTIEKFRELVLHLQSEVSELRRAPEDGVQASASAPSTISHDTALMNQLKTSAVKSYSRTIDYELRKLEAIQAADTINHLKAFLPNSFLVSGGDYDALSVTMLLPRLVFKSDLIIDQLKQQTKLEDVLFTLSSVKPGSNADLLTYVAFLIYKLTTLQELVNRFIRVLGECDVQMYWQAGGLRDDLIIHEKALDILVKLLKKEQLDESVPLNGIEKAIVHFDMLLRTRFTHECHTGHKDHLLGQIGVVTAGCDYCSLELVRLKFFTTGSTGFVTQLREMETLSNDIRQFCRKIRRRVPATSSGKIVVCPPELLPAIVAQQQALATNYRALYSKVYQKSQGLGEGETLPNGEFETFMEEVAKLVLQEMIVSLKAEPSDVVHSTLSSMSQVLEKFLNDLQDGVYDTKDPKTKVISPLVTRAQIVKGELSDTEGLKYKIEEKGKETLELKKTIKLKGQEMGEVNVKVDLLEKKLEMADAECARKVEEEKMETERIKTVMEQQERKFNKAIQMLQGDLESLETERDNLKREIDNQSNSPIPGDISGTRRSLSMGRQALTNLLAKSSPSSSPRRLHTAPSGTKQGTEPIIEAGYNSSPLLLANIDSLKKALSFTQDENIRLKAQVAKKQMSALPPLVVPRRSTGTVRSGEKGGVKEDGRTDGERSIVTRTTQLLQDLNSVISTCCVVDITNKAKGPTPNEQLAQQLSVMLDLRQKANKLKEETELHLATSYPGGVVQTSVKPFVSAQFSKALNESASPPLLARLRLPKGSDTPTCSPQRVYLSANQFEALHSVVVS